MKTARFLLACAVVSVLAACGTDTITAPAAPAAGAKPRFDSSQMGTGTATDSAPSVSTTSCIPVVVTSPDGTTSVQCQVDSNSQMGTGT
jgi:hypothetical protein